MINLIYIILWILWNFFMIFDAYKEAHLYYYAIDSKNSIKELHPTYFIQRFIVFILLIIPLILLPIIWYKILLFISCIILCQPFIHNGMYYHTRNKLNNKIYPKKWFDMSTTSTAKSTKYFTAINRIILFVISCILLILCYF